MQEYPPKYSLLEKKADKLWVEWHPQEDATVFWQAYDQLLLQAHNAQKEAVMSKANESVQSFTSVEQNPVVATPSATVKMPLSRAIPLGLTLFLVFGVVLYRMVNNRPAEQPLIENTEVMTVQEVEVEPANSWRRFKSVVTYSLSVNEALPDSLAIAAYKKTKLMDSIMLLQVEVKKNKSLLDEANSFLKNGSVANDEVAAAVEAKNKYERLVSKHQNKLNQIIEKLKKHSEWYDKAHKEYSITHGMNMMTHAANMILADSQSVEKAWDDLMSEGQPLKNISKHNQPVLDLAMEKETNWLFVANRQTMTLHRVMTHKGAYFALNNRDKLEPIDLATQTIHKAQIKVYYQGQLVTYTPQKAYYELNGKQHKVAIKDFDKLEKRLEISQHYPSAK